jgi:hypothetical protein
MIDRRRLEEYVMTVKINTIVTDKKHEYIKLFMDSLTDQYLDYYYRAGEQEWYFLENQELHDIKIVSKGVFNKVEGIEFILSDTEIFISVLQKSFMNLAKTYNLENRHGYRIDHNGLLLKISTENTRFFSNNKKADKYHFINIK